MLLGVSVVVAGGLLASCSGGTSGAGASTAVPGVLTVAGIPSALGLEQNRSSTTSSLGQAYGHVYPGCTGHFAAFTGGGRAPTPVSVGTTIYVQVYALHATCASVAKAQAVFRSDARQTETNEFHGRAVSGIGDAAVAGTMSKARADEYVIFWRHGATLGFLQLSGPAGAPRISAAETAVLARHQVTGK
ncbi:MAG: hypothetical protein ACRDY1_01400 [Acidimicrobiales bacterium]